MFDTELYSEHISNNALTCDDRNYNPDKPRIKDILWAHYEWLYDLYMHGGVREAVLDNVQKTLLCNTFYLGSDYFVCPECNNFNIVNHKCHSRFCTSCGVNIKKFLQPKLRLCVLMFIIVILFLPSLRNIDVCSEKTEKLSIFYSLPQEIPLL